MVIFWSFEEEVRLVMRSRYICFWGPLPVIIASMGGSGLAEVDADVA